MSGTRPASMSVLFPAWPNSRFPWPSDRGERQKRCRIHPKRLDASGDPKSALPARRSRSHVPRSGSYQRAVIMTDAPNRAFRWP